jgi:hypothetical protein
MNLLRHLACSIALIFVSGCLVRAQDYGPWGDPQPVAAITSAAVDGCPIESSDGQTLYFASGRTDAGAEGMLDNWRVRRASLQSDWSTIENLGPVANSPEFDYCPTPLRGHALLFVSSRRAPDDCRSGAGPPPPSAADQPAAGDIFATTEDDSHAWSTPVALGCYPNGPNTRGAELGPSIVTTSAGKFLFFSSNGYPDSQGQDIYASPVLGDGTVQAGVRVAELSSAADDRMPNARSDGLEIVFSSDRSGNMDIYVATRTSGSAPWSAPQPLANPRIDTRGTETCASLSTDGTRLYFGRKADASHAGGVFAAARSRLAAAQNASTPNLSVANLALLIVLLASTWFVGLRLVGNGTARK